MVAAKAAVQETKAEYDVLLQESRDPAFIKEYGTETLTELKDVAKGEWQAALRFVDCRFFLCRFSVFECTVLNCIVFSLCSAF